MSNTKKSWQAKVQKGFESAFKKADEVKIPGTNRKLGSFVDRTSRKKKGSKQ